MGLLTFSINVTLDGCVDHQEGIVDDEIHAFFTRLMDEGGAMLWGRVTYEMMESYCIRDKHSRDSLSSTRPSLPPSPGRLPSNRRIGRYLTADVA